MLCVQKIKYDGKILYKEGKMEKERKTYEVEVICEILKRTSRNRGKEYAQFGDGISVRYDCIEKTIREVDELFTRLVHGGVCENCEESCQECELGIKKR